MNLFSECLVWGPMIVPDECAFFQPDRSEALSQMHSVLVEKSKAMRTGPGPGSLKQTDDSSLLDAFFTGNDASGNLDHDPGQLL